MPTAIGPSTFLELWVCSWKKSWGICEIDPGAVAGLAVGVDRTPVPDRLQRIDRRDHHVAPRLAIDRCDEAHAAGVALVTRANTCRDARDKLAFVEIVPVGLLGIERRRTVAGVAVLVIPVCSFPNASKLGPNASKLSSNEQIQLPTRRSGGGGGQWHLFSRRSRLGPGRLVLQVGVDALSGVPAVLHAPDHQRRAAHDVAAGEHAFHRSSSCCPSRS